MRPPRFWARDGLAPRLLDPLGRAYAALGRRRRERSRPYAAPLPVVCVGNLTLGGAGKTPTVLALAAWLTARGARPFAVTRGHGGRERGPLRVDPARHGFREVGDEALLLAAALPTIVARDRPAGIDAAFEAGAGLVLLDDGFQNPRLRPDLAVIAVDGGSGFGNGRVFPAGPLREPVDDGLARARAALLIGEDRAGVGSRLAASLPVLTADLAPADDAPDLRGRHVLAFAGIGRPAKFFASLEAAGARLAAARAFPDHHPYRPAELRALLDESERLGVPLVTTAKDRVRLPPDLRDRVLVLPVVLRFRAPERLNDLFAGLGVFDRSRTIFSRKTIP